MTKADHKFPLYPSTPIMNLKLVSKFFTPKKNFFFKTSKYKERVNFYDYSLDRKIRYVFRAEKFPESHMKDTNENYQGLIHDQLTDWNPNSKFTPEAELFLLSLDETLFECRKIEPQFIRETPLLQYLFEYIEELELASLLSKTFISICSIISSLLRLHVYSPSELLNPPFDLYHIIKKHIYEDNNIDEDGACCILSEIIQKGDINENLFLKFFKHALSLESFHSEYSKLCCLSFLQKTIYLIDDYPIEQLLNIISLISNIILKKSLQPCICDSIYLLDSILEKYPRMILDIKTVQDLILSIISFFKSSDEEEIMAATYLSDTIIQMEDFNIKNSFLKILPFSSIFENCSHLDQKICKQSLLLLKDTITNGPEFIQSYLDHEGLTVPLFEFNDSSLAIKSLYCELLISLLNYAAYDQIVIIVQSSFFLDIIETLHVYHHTLQLSFLTSFIQSLDTNSLMNTLPNFLKFLSDNDIWRFLQEIMDQDDGSTDISNFCQKILSYQPLQ